MEELNENNAFLNQMRELVNDLELHLRREAWSSNASVREPPFQQFSNSYPQDHHYFSAQDQFHFQNSDLVLDSYNSAYGDAYPNFQQQEASFYPQPYAHSQNEHGYYPHSYSMNYQQEEQFLDYQPWSCNDPQPPLMSEEAFAAIMEALKPSSESFSKQEVEAKESTFWSHEAVTSWRSQDVVVEDNREEEGIALAMVDQEQGLSQEAEKLEISTSAGKFRIGEELNEEETELIFSLLSAHYQGEIQQQKEEEKVEKELNLDHDSSLRMKGKEATARYDFTYADFDFLLQEMDYLLQYGESENQEKDVEKEGKSFPYSPLLHNLVEKDVEDFTCEDFDLLLHEESYTMAGHNHFQEEKQERTAPSLQRMKAAEPLYPQSTTPRHQEEEAEKLVTSENLPFDFKLISNQFLLVVNELVSGGELHKKQLNLKNLYKLQLKFLYGEVHKRGANGDGVLWNIKVHPP